MNNNNYLGTMALQLAMIQLTDGNGDAYYSGPIDGKLGTETIAAARRMLESIVPSQEQEKVYELPADVVMVFSRAADGEQRISEHFKVREFACHDGSDVVFIHPILPVWAEEIRELNGPFTPNSAYRTPGHNAAVGGAALSKHCWGIAMDIPAVNATPQQLYAAAEKIMGDTGGLGIYDWGIHMDCREEKARWDERSQ